MKNIVLISNPFEKSASYSFVKYVAMKASKKLTIGVQDYSLAKFDNWKPLFETKSLVKILENEGLSISMLENFDFTKAKIFRCLSLCVLTLKSWSMTNFHTMLISAQRCISCHPKVWSAMPIRAMSQIQIWLLNLFSIESSPDKVLAIEFFDVQQNIDGTQYREDSLWKWLFVFSIPFEHVPSQCNIYTCIGPWNQARKSLPMM